MGAFYRPPSSGEDYLEHLNNSLNQIPKNSKSHIWLAGDFNLPEINWPNSSVIDNAKRPKLHSTFLETINDHRLDQVNHKPTRGNNILDLFFTNNSSLVNRS
jgi:hypothetical protein